MNRGRLFNTLSLVMLGLTAITILCYLLIAINPYLPINPFPPAPREVASYRHHHSFAGPSCNRRTAEGHIRTLRQWSIFREKLYLFIYRHRFSSES